MLKFLKLGLGSFICCLLTGCPRLEETWQGWHINKLRQELGPEIQAVSLPYPRKHWSGKIVTIAYTFAPASYRPTLPAKCDFDFYEHSTCTDGKGQKFCGRVVLTDAAGFIHGYQVECPLTVKQFQDDYGPPAVATNLNPPRPYIPYALRVFNIQSLPTNINLVTVQIWNAKHHPFHQPSVCRFDGETGMACLNLNTKQRYCGYTSMSDAEGYVRELSDRCDLSKAP